MSEGGLGKSHYSPTTAFSRSRSATISFFNEINSPTEQADAAEIDCGTARAWREESPKAIAAAGEDR